MGGATREALVLRNCRRKRPRGFASGGLLIVAVSCSPLLGDVDVDEASTDGRALGEEFLPAIPSGASAVQPSSEAASDEAVRGECAGGSFRCGGAQLDYCDDGAWLPWQMCASALLCESEPAGRCLPPACTVGQRRCNSATLEGCNADGTAWSTIDVCESAAYCNAGAGCRVSPCLNGQSRCNDGLVEVCRSDGLGWDFVERCVSVELCANDPVAQRGVCLDPACARGESRCLDGGTRGVCNAERTAFVPCTGADCGGETAGCDPAQAPLGEPPLGEPPLGGPPAAPGSVTDPPALDCVFGPFERLERLTNDSNGDYWSPSMSSDSLTVYFGGNRLDEPEHIFSTVRADPEAEFLVASPTRGVNSVSSEGTPVESFDGRTLYFYSTRPGGRGDRDLWVVTRADRSSDFASPSNLASVNSTGDDQLPWLSRDELMLVFSSTRAGGSGSADLWVSRRASRGEAFSAPAALGGVNSSAYEGRAALASDQRSIIFASRRDGGRGNNDLWAASRTSLAQDFGPAENLVELNSSDADIDPSLSDDGRELLFVSNRRGRSEIFRATRPCD